LTTQKLVYDLNVELMRLSADAGDASLYTSVANSIQKRLGWTNQRMSRIKSNSARTLSNAEIELCERVIDEYRQQLKIGKHNV